MIEIVGGAQSLRVIETGGVVERVVADEKVARGQQRDSVRNREFIDNDGAHLDIRAVDVERGGEGVNVNGCEGVRRDHEHQFVVCRKHGYGHVVVHGAGETQFTGNRSNLLQQSACGGFVGRFGHLDFVETIVFLIVCEQIEHDTVFIVFIRVARHVHDTRDKIVQPVLVCDGGTQFVRVNGDGVLVAAVLRVENLHRVGSVHFQQSLHVILIRVCLNPLRHNFLNGRTIVKLRALERCERVVEPLTPDVGHADAINKDIDKLIVILLVHGREQCVHGRGDTVDGGVGDALLKIVGAREPRFSHDGAVVDCHNMCLLISR